MKTRSHFRINLPRNIATLVVGLLGMQVLFAADKIPTIAEKVAGMERHGGFITYYLDMAAGKIWLQIDKPGEEFLYVNSLATGLGSNPVGLDRGQLGSEKVVKFERFGPKVMLIQPNLDYRADSDNKAEQKAVAESFAPSILWGFKVAAESGGKLLIDATDFLLRDAHNVIGTLKRTRQGSFKKDASRSTIYPERCKAFPDNTELEVMLTFTSAEPGRLVRSTAATGNAVTLRQHHSFIRLPDDKYEVRVFDPRAGVFGITYADYATPLDQPLLKRFIARHRLQKKDPAAAVSEPIEPIIYYLDPGAPEPVRSALLDGAGWWNQAFEAAGYKDAFRVEILPEGADPLDVRYNMIQWVHRSTRGWSYGSSVADPRTGEIIKGHVSLGSLRVRQDRMLIEGLDPIFSDNAQSGFGYCAIETGPELAALVAQAEGTTPVEVALARIRQLAAHEVGHTLGFAHNYISSTYNRGSVMDYPAPLVKVTDGKLDFSDAYGVGIGEWDKLTVQYAYSDFPSSISEAEGLAAIIKRAIDEKLLFITDSDSRPAGSAHPLASLWDNGADPIDALNLTMEVRKIGLEQFGDHSIPEGQPVALLSKVLVPLYLHHRYQVEATTKSIGGVYYNYSVKGDNLMVQRPETAARQRAALSAVLKTIAPSALVLPQKLIDRLPPMPFGYTGTQELFPSQTAMIFDPLAVAQLAAQITVKGLLQYQRAARLVALNQQNQKYPGLEEVIDKILAETWRARTPGNVREAAIARVVERVVVENLIDLASNRRASIDVRAISSSKLKALAGELRRPQRKDTSIEAAHRNQVAGDIVRFLNRAYDADDRPQALDIPPGSPIGERQK